MTEIDMLKAMPKEHYTTHNGKIIKVGALLKLLLEQEEKKAAQKKKD